MRRSVHAAPGGPHATLRRRVAREAGVVALATLLVAVASVVWDLPARIEAWSHRFGFLDDAVLLLAASHLIMLVFGSRRAADLKTEFAQRQHAEEELRRRARTDALTGLLNRSGLADELSAATGEGRAPAVLLVELDRFREVNDTLGHAVGDALLCAVAIRLAEAVGEEAALARLGGDEFVVLLPGMPAEAVGALADRLLEALRRPFEVDGLTLEVDASIGVALAETGGTDLLRAADIAMYDVKARHGGVGIFSPAMDRHDPGKLAVFGELRRAIREGELRIHYQPKVAVADGRVLGVEALVRWQHPARGLLAPAEFIDIAEATGLVRPLTDAVLDQALADCRRWRDDGLRLTVAVNLSARVLLDTELPERLAGMLRVHGVPADALELEVTESSAMKDPDQALDILRRLRTLGVTLSIDDYGTGHASLSYLSRLPVSTLKIDRSFVSIMELSDQDRVIVRSTIELAHALGLRVVAEGVETRCTWEHLRALGCDEAQGYWLGRPQPVEHLHRQLEDIDALRIGGSGRDGGALSTTGDHGVAAG